MTGDLTLAPDGSGWPVLVPRGARERLYLRGDPRALTLPAVLVIGTRQASRAGCVTAYLIAGALARAGVTVVSGLAVGCDAAAHRGALSVGGATVAVLAHGLDARTYPAEHIALARAIATGPGALVTEYEAATPAAPWRFAVRDKLQAELALAVVLAEAPAKSGSFHAIRRARELGRPIFAASSANDGFQHEGMQRAIDEFGARRVHTVAQLLRGLAPLLGGVTTEGKTA